MPETPAISVVIPTYGREAVLCDTIQRAAELFPAEILVIDQTDRHEEATMEKLADFEREGVIRRILLPEPNIPRAMNTGLLAAGSPVVLYLDDDVVPSPGILDAHLRAHAGSGDIRAVVGQVLQPGEEPKPLRQGEAFRFNATETQDLRIAIACNFSVKRTPALTIGGFDENFVMVAYCFETEFAERVVDAGGRVVFEPAASIRHLRAPRGGTRGHGEHLTTPKPTHSVGAHYYFLLRNPAVTATVLSLKRTLRAIRTRHHLTHPWHILNTLTAEVRGYLLARKLHAHGPRLLNETRTATEGQGGTATQRSNE